MGVKSEITWKQRCEDGARREVNARKVGDRWLFFSRERRFENWQPLEKPALEDWLELLDAVERRVPRRLYQPDDVERLRRQIGERFPDVKWH